MFTAQELLHALAIPATVCSLIAGFGRWRCWRWAMPLAAGAGFLCGYALFGVPRLPPRDGTDWLFWIAIVLTPLAAFSTFIDQSRWSPALGAVAGPAVLMLLWPLVPHALPAGLASSLSLLLGAAGVNLILLMRFIESRLGAAPLLFAYATALGGAAIVVLSSNLRIVGIYGLAAASALLPLVLLALGSERNRFTGSSIAILSNSLLVGLLVSGRYYPDPGVGWLQFVLLLGSPALLVLGIPMLRVRRWIAMLVSMTAVIVCVAVVTVPTALAARKAAEADAYPLYP